MSYSQTTFQITQDQIKIANLIFLEHEQYSKEIPLLKQQIINLEYLNNNWIKQDSLNKQNFKILNSTILKQDNQIVTLNHKLKIRTGITIGSLIILLITCLVK